MNKSISFEKSEKVFDHKVETNCQHGENRMMSNKRTKPSNLVNVHFMSVSLLRIVKHDCWPINDPVTA